MTDAAGHTARSHAQPHAADPRPSYRSASTGDAVSRQGQLTRRVVAIDGPAGAGKSTVAARIAQQFSLLNLETGAMYRAFALKVLRSGLDPDDAAVVQALSLETSITLEPAETGNRVLLDQADVTAELRTPEITQAASRVSVHAAIRTWMVGLQRELGAQGNVVMEGRDIGTAVFPDADVKIFLDASAEARSQRRYQQGAPASPARGLDPALDAAPGTALGTAPRGTASQSAGPGPDESTDRSAAGDPYPAAGQLAVLAELRERDQRDRERTQSPLRPAEDAIVIDSTSLTLDEVIERVASLITARWALAPPP